jgi:antitoxin YokJ
MGVAVTHRLHPARLRRCYDSLHEVHGIPGACEIIAASFSAMVMEFLNDPGHGWYCTSPDGPRPGDAHEVP